MKPKKFLALCINPGAYMLKGGGVYKIWLDPRAPDYYYEFRDDRNCLCQSNKHRFMPLSKLLEE